MKHMTLRVLALSAMTAGCAPSPLQPALGDAAVTVPAAAQCTFTQEYRERQNCCVMKPYRSAMDVDTAYGRAVREYEFSARPQPYDLEGEAYPHINHGHRYEAQQF